MCPGSHAVAAERSLRSLRSWCSLAVLVPAALLSAACLGACAASSIGATRATTTKVVDGLTVTETRVRGAGGEWVLDGRHETRFENGELMLAGEYRAGVRSGVWERLGEGGVLESRGSYLAGKREGVWVYRNPDGSLDADRTGVYEDGERIKPWWEDGIRIGVLNSGLTQHSEYRRGLRNGRSISFYPAGAKESEGNYEDGLRSGAWSFWNEDGTLDAERTGFYENHDRVRDPAAGEGNAATEDDS